MRITVLYYYFPFVNLLILVRYVLFTSGSTGVPKGVMIENRSAVNTILFVLKRFSVSESDTILSLNALHFDLSVFDIFGALGSGARLVIPQPEHVC